jgi:S-(hydroxymethyl)glutathione dehydrogenase/alcohol dehydrogenase
MRAVIFSEVGQELAVEDVEALDPGPHDVVVRIEATGLCGTDLHLLRGSLPHPAPAVMGHEAAGCVEAVGSAVARVRVGDRVVASPAPCCGACWYCSQGEPSLCEALGRLLMTPRVRRKDGSKASGMVGLGSFADMMTVDESSVVAVQTDLPAEQLALVGCGVTTGLGAALVRARVQPGATVAVIGCGAVGLSVVQGARIAGAARIIGIDLNDQKRAVSLRVGATDAIDPSEGDVGKQVRELTGGRGVDYAFEAVGRSDTTAQAIEIARPGGSIVIVGAPAPDDRLDIPLAEFFMAEKKVMSTRFGTVDIRRDFPRFVRLAETGQLDLASLVSRVVTLDDSAVATAFDDLERGETIRTVFVP